jgi:hypothetical protein
VDAPHHALELSIAPRRALLWLMAISVSLVLAGTLSMIAWLGFGHAQVFGFRPLFDLDAENNIPSYFSTLQLLTVAVLLGVIARHETLIRSSWRWHFLALSLGFALLSVDEAASIHERVLARLGRSVVGSDTIQFTWLVPGVVIVAVVALAYVRFLLALPRRFAVLFVASGALFVAGSIAAEWVGSEIAGRTMGDDANWAFQIEVIIEEGLEMTGLSLFVYSLLAYVAEARIGLVVSVRS